jgi:hypothetical protein
MGRRHWSNEEVSSQRLEAFIEALGEDDCLNNIILDSRQIFAFAGGCFG